MNFTVANLTLQTLVSTYPDSEYAGKAKLVLEDPRIAKCGNSAKRMSGTESRAPTKNPPTESNAPRKERLLSGDNPEPKEASFSECPAPSTMPSPSANTPWNLA